MVDFDADVHSARWYKIFGKWDGQPKGLTDAVRVLRDRRGAAYERLRTMACADPTLELNSPLKRLWMACVCKTGSNTSAEISLSPYEIEYVGMSIPVLEDIV